MAEPRPFDGAPLLGPAAEEAQRAAEGHAGVRCDGCGQRITREWEGAYEYIAFRALVEDGRPTMLTERRYACSRESCADFHDELRSQAVAMRPIDGWTFLDDDQ